MKVAISTDGDVVSAHFGRCPEFTLLEINNGAVEKRETIANPGHHPGYIPQFLHERGVECIICGGMGMRATGFFQEFRIKTVLGVSGKVDEVITKFLDGTLLGGQSLCQPGEGKGYGVEKSACDHPEQEHCDEEQKGE